MTENWPVAILGQLEFYWDFHLRPRLEGLTDDEYFWEPVDGCWSLRPGPDGSLRMEQEYPAPEPPPFTTIAWRMTHISRDIFGIRARALFGPHEGLDDADMFDQRLWPEPLPATAADAVATLERAYTHWHDAVAALTPAQFAAPSAPKQANTPPTPSAPSSSTSTARPWPTEQRSPSSGTSTATST
nr:DinB family protein [Glycomyces mayteni]